MEKEPSTTVHLDNEPKVGMIIELLEKEHPDAKIALHYSNPLELLIATILSAQCTDERVNLVTEKLFKKYKTAEDYADADLKELAQRLGLTKNEDPGKIEEDLMRIVPKKYWMRITDLLIFHGRRICIAKKPKCGICVLNKTCPCAFKFD
jgi:endonuclease III